MVNRKRNPRFYSIERVFGQLVPEFEKYYTVKLANALFYSESILKVIRNILSLWDASKADLYHVTGDIHYAVFSFPSSRTVLTIHDVVLMHQARGVKKVFFRYLFLKWPVCRAAIITTISEKSKEEIISITGCRPEKITVIPNSCPQEIYFKPSVFNVNKPVILFIGTTVNKNLERAVEALEGIPCLLKIIGTLEESQSALLRLKKINYEEMRGLSNMDMADQYAAADIILFPSLYEGFGMPVIEGQKAGRPVITSNLRPMNEVAGGGACLVDPTDVLSIREGVSKVINDTLFREQIVSRGFENVVQYSPENIAGKYIKLYQQAIENGN